MACRLIRIPLGGKRTRRIMPYELSWEGGGVRTAFRGVVTADDLIRSNLEIYKDARFETIRYEIADFREAESRTFDAEAIRSVAHLDRAQSVRNPNMKVAIIASGALARGFARVYALSGGDSPWVTQFFETEEDAVSWLAA